MAYPLNSADAKSHVADLNVIGSRVIIHENKKRRKKMKSLKKTARILEDVKIKLSALWAVIMFLYIYMRMPSSNSIVFGVNPSITEYFHSLFYGDYFPYILCK
jgi:hypothetical protein